MILGAIPVAGVLLTALAVGANSDLDFPHYQFTTPARSVTDASLALRAAQVEEFKEIWSDDPDPLTRGLVAFGMAQQTQRHDWSSEAIDIFREIIANQGSQGSGIELAYLGSVYATAARDYPLQGMWHIVPGPGFIRLFNVQQAFVQLNKAIKEAPLDPVVRLIRAASMVGLKSFGGAEEGLADFALLAQWIKDKQANPDYRSMLDDKSFQAEFLFNYANALELLERYEETKPLWEKIIQISNDKQLVELGKWKLKA